MPCLRPAPHRLTTPRCRWLPMSSNTRPRRLPTSWIRLIQPITTLSYRGSQHGGRRDTEQSAAQPFCGSVSRCTRRRGPRSCWTCQPARRLAFGRAHQPDRRRGIFGRRESADAHDADVPVPAIRPRADEPQPRNTADALGSRAGVHRHPLDARPSASAGAGASCDQDGGLARRRSAGEQHQQRQGRRGRDHPGDPQPSPGARIHVEPRHASADGRAALAPLLRSHIPRSPKSRLHRRRVGLCPGADFAGQPENDAGASGPGAAGLQAAEADAAAESLARNSQVINAMGMLSESILHWGRRQAPALTVQSQALDRNFWISGASKFVRLVTQITILGTGAYLALHAEITGGMMIAASIVAGRALQPLEGLIEGWRSCVQARSAYARVKQAVESFQRETPKLRLPKPQGRLTMDRVLYLPPGSKEPVLNGVSLELAPGESLARVGPSGSGKST